MNILYITFVDFKSNENIGVKNKIIGQVSGLRKNGHNVSYTYMDADNFKYCDFADNERVIKKFKNRVDFTINKYRDELICLSKSADIIYIRYNMSSRFFINFLKQLKKYGKKIYVEIPTYPYDNELSKKRLFLEKIYRIKMKNYVTNIFLSSNKEKEVFEIPTVFLGNGIDVSRIKIKSIKIEESKDRINIIGLSLMRNSVGYDRVINGLKKYYDKKNKDLDIYIELYGDGPELNNLKDLVNKLQLEEHVNFKGVITGDELDYAFEKADIAIGSLGDHRVGVNSKSPLKTREYCARGIPFISSVNDPGFSKKNKFILNVEADESPIDMEDVIEFYKGLNKFPNISEYIRGYAEENFDWSIYFKDKFK